MKITLEEEELRQLLNERDHLRRQVTELQERNTQLIEAERELNRIKGIVVQKMVAR